MTKNEIRDVIINKRNQGIDPTPEDIAIASQYFTHEEIECMRMPIIDHTGCYCPVDTSPTTIKLHD